MSTPCGTPSPQALETGADDVEVQELLGHSSLNITRRYLEATAAQLRDVVHAHPSQIALREATAEPSRRGGTPPPNTASPQ